MATYIELSTLESGKTLEARLAAAIAIQAEAIRTESVGTTNHSNRIIWAKQSFQDPRAMAQKMVWALLAQNAAATNAAIVAATDAALLTAVAAAVDVFATGA